MKTVIKYNSQIDWEMHTDSSSIPHLVGVLTWHDLLDRNYLK